MSGSLRVAIKPCSANSKSLRSSAATSWRISSTALMGVPGLCDHVTTVRSARNREALRDPQGGDLERPEREQAGIVLECDGLQLVLERVAQLDVAHANCERQSCVRGATGAFVESQDKSLAVLCRFYRVDHDVRRFA